MKIAVIHGSPRKGSTYNCTEIVKQTMSSMGEVTFEDIFLPEDAPVFCKGCFTCFGKGEENCPNARYIQPIAKKLEEADGWIVATPVYAMQISGALKALLDHLAYNFLNHRPRFFNKKVLILSTTAGAGVQNCNKYLKENFTFWGVNHIDTYGIVTFSDGWKGIKPQKKEKITQKLKQKAESFYQEVGSKKIHSPQFLQILMFYFSKILMKRYEEWSLDRAFWKKNGWLEKKRKYFIEAPIDTFRKGCCQAISFLMDKTMK